MYKKTTPSQPSPKHIRPNCGRRRITAASGNGVRDHADPHRLPVPPAPKDIEADIEETKW